MEAEHRLARAEHQSARAAASLKQEVTQLRRTLLESEQTAARALNLERSLDELEAEHARVAERLAYSERVIADMKASASWRLTAPLRWVKALLTR